MPDPTRLNVAAIMKDTRMVGPGLRDAVWVQGCSLRCQGCANQAYLPHEARRMIPVGRMLCHFKARRTRIDGVSLLGGEPTEQLKAVSHLLQGVQKLGLSTVVFTGHTLEYLRQHRRYERLLAHTDLLIDGRFVASRARSDLYWRGSDNQRFLRLSDRFSEADLRGPPATGEIVISGDQVLLHGVGAVLPRLGGHSAGHR